MHDEAETYVREILRVTGFRGSAPRVLELGSRDVNGTLHRALTEELVGYSYIGLDLQQGPNVDVVADACTWRGGTFDLVLCCELLEHVERWRDVVWTAWYHVAAGGWMILTAAGPARAVHSGFEESPGLGPGEWYQNIRRRALEKVLEQQAWAMWQIEYRRDRQDVVAFGHRARLGDGGKGKGEGDG